MIRSLNEPGMDWMDEKGRTITYAPPLYAAIPDFKRMREGRDKPIYDELVRRSVLGKCASKQSAGAADNQADMWAW